MIVSVEELKAHLRIQQNAEDALLERLLHQAQAAANDFCRTDFDADAPEPARLAVLLMASHFYEYRDASDRSAYLTMINAFHAPAKTGMPREESASCTRFIRAPPSRPWCSGADSGA